ncbi:E3 ubiquitin-protein ligase [Quillaja saponaria]|uniref:E3 ubiquitin-protein ligase n=1 Tax=Quillaja saponaria TaxID=32244 RepID=A0AAD7L136_QUISA|nr:E3 ubiquitin-protein ligase [Quillaja saponaria]
METSLLPCQANCSHWFCGNCILLVWHHGPAIQPCKCPLCRRHITLLVPNEASLKQRHNPDVAEILNRIERYNRLFGERTTGLIQMILSAIYIISPVDIIPEGILGIVGLLDDLLVVLICFLHVAAIYRSVLFFRHGGT